MLHSYVLIYGLILCGAFGWFLTSSYAAFRGKLWIAYLATTLWFVRLGLALYAWSVETYDITRAGLSYMISLHVMFGLIAVLAWRIGTWLRKRSQI